MVLLCGEVLEFGDEVMVGLLCLACDQIREKDGGVVVGCGGDGSPCVGGSPGDQDLAWP
jgi:hypothetical protein